MRAPTTLSQTPLQLTTYAHCEMHGARSATVRPSEHYILLIKFKKNRRTLVGRGGVPRVFVSCDSEAEGRYHAKEKDSTMKVGEER